jgi:hypothetical protein
MKKIIIFLLFLSSASFAKDIEPVYKKYETTQIDIFKLRLEEIFPKPVAEYLFLKSWCTHWDSEGGYEDKVEGECKTLRSNKKELLEKHQKDKILITLFNKVDLEDNCIDQRCEFIFDDPGHKSKELNIYYEAEAQSLINYYKQDLGKKDPQKSLSNTFGKRGYDFNEVEKNKDRLHSKTLSEYNEMRIELKKRGINPQ